MKIVKSLKNKISETINCIKAFQMDPIDNTGKLIPTAMVLLGVLSFLVAYIMFWVGNGYGIQIELMKEDFWTGLIKSFTLGKIGIIYTSFVPVIVCLMFVIQFILATITFFINASKIKIIFMGILGGLSILIPIIITVICFFDLPVGNGIYFLGTMLIIQILFIVFLSLSRAGWMIGEGIIALLIYFGVIPITLLALQNIVPLIIVIISLAIAFLFVGGGGGGEYSGSNTTSESGSYSNSYEKQRLERIASEEKLNEKKKNDRINQLLRERTELKSNIQKHYDKQIGYGTIDPKSCNNRIKKIEEELKRYGIM